MRRNFITLLLRSIFGKKKIICAIFTLLFLTMPFDVASANRPGCYTDYRFDQEGPFYNFDIFVTWDVAPEHAYIYPAFTFSFEAGQGGYMGTQIVGDVRKVIFSIWDIEEGNATAIPVSSNGRRFSGEGTGAQCLFEYDWVPNREYRLRIWEAGSDSNGEYWSAYINDTVSGIDTIIGTIYLKNSKGYKGYGWLKNGVGTFLEYFGGSDTPYGQPHSKVTWRGPYANNGEYTASSARVPFYPTNCTTNNVLSSGWPFVTHEAGDSVEETISSGTNLWASSNVGTRSVLIDEGHSEWLNSGNTLKLTQDLRDEGYTVDTITGTVTQSVLSAYNVYVVGSAWGSFTQSEIQAIDDFVQNGGGLLLIGLGWSWVDYHSNSTIYDYPVNEIAQNFGAFFNPDIVFDPTDYTTSSDSAVFHTPFIFSHPSTTDVSYVGAIGANIGSISIQTGTILITGDDDSYGGYHTSPYLDPGMHPTIFAAIEHGLGRIIVGSHECFFTDNHIDEYDNKILAVNIIDWLALGAFPVTSSEVVNNYQQAWSNGIAGVLTLLKGSLYYTDVTVKLSFSNGNQIIKVEVPSDGIAYYRSAGVTVPPTVNSVVTQDGSGTYSIEIHASGFSFDALMGWASEELNAIARGLGLYTGLAGQIIESNPLITLQKVVVTDNNGNTHEVQLDLGPLPTYLSSLHIGTFADIGTVLQAASPIHLLVIDEQGNRVGAVYNTNGTFVNDVNEIMGAFYTGRMNDEFIFMPPEITAFTVRAVGVANGNYTIRIMSLSNNPSEKEEVGSIESSQSVQYTVNVQNETITTFYPGLTIAVQQSGSVSYSYNTNLGTLVGGSTQVIFLPTETSILLSAQPSSFIYQFNGWSGAISSSNSQLTLNVNSPMNMEASFGYNYMNIGIIVSIPIIVIIGIIGYRHQKVEKIKVPKGLDETENQMKKLDELFDKGEISRDTYVKLKTELEEKHMKEGKEHSKI